ncbi:hypothetical protein E4T39_07250 [Aureobasidium subglaciale]|nr:hypothetical protein E4T39_07250 [Aureobasidium subglaciale]
MHSRHAVITCSRLNRFPFHLSTRRYLSQNVHSSLVEAATSNHGTSIPSTPDDSPPLKKRSSRKSNIKTALEISESSLAAHTDVPLLKRRGRPPKTVDNTEADIPETTEATEAPPKKRIRKPKTSKDQPVIAHGSLHHHNLDDFLTYATTANLSPTSTVYRGTHYEYTVANSLTRLAFSLTRVGRTSDLGIDLLGSWAIPSRPAPLNILIQCKAEAPKPSMIRELEGAVVGAPVRYRGQGTIAILAAAKEATKGVRDAVARSRLPMAYLNITTEGSVRQFVWNQAAVECALESVGVTLRYLTNGESEVALTWKGLPWSLSSSKPSPLE